MNDAAWHEAEAARLAKQADDSTYNESTQSHAAVALAHAEIAKSMRLGEIAAAIRDTAIVPEAWEQR